MTVGQRIKAKREQLELSQGDLAKIMGISRQAVSKAELHDSNITTDKVRKFAKALGVTEAYLMGWIDEENPNFMKNLEDARDKGDLKAQAFIDAITPKFLDDLNSDEYILLRTYREATPEEKRMLIEMCAFFRSKKQE